MYRLRIAISPLRAFAICCIFLGAVASGYCARPALGQGADDRSVARAIVSSLEGDSAHASITGDALRRAKVALERATRFRGAEEGARATLAEGVAREWAEAARDLVSAADAEASAAQVRRRAVDAQERLERSRVLVEEEIARVGRLDAQLRASEHGKRVQGPQ